MGFTFGIMGASFGFLGMIIANNAMAKVQKLEAMFEAAGPSTERDQP